MSGASAELQKIDRQGDLAQSRLNKLSSVSSGTAGTFKQAQQQAAELSAKISTAKDKVQLYTQGVTGMNTVIKQSRTEQASLQTQIDKVNKQYQESNEKVKSLSSAYTAAQKEIKAAAKAHGEESDECKKAKEQNKEITDAYNKAVDSSGKYRNELLQLESRHEKLGTEIKDSKEKLTEFRTKVNDTEASINKMSNELALAESKVATFAVGMQGFGTGLQTIGERVGKLGTALTLGVTTPLVDIGVAAVKAGNDFEAQMSRVKAISGAAGKDFEKLEQQAIDLGAETSFSASEAAEAMENLASAGFDTTEIMAAMPGMLDLAASSGEGLASSADIAASTLRGFGLEADYAGHVADVLAKNAADTNAAIADTGLAMKYVAPVAHSAGWSLESVTAAIGKMADAGIKGEQAGTTLRGALTRLMKPTEAMQGAMDALGITFYDSEGKMKPLSTIVDDLQTSTANLTDEQRDNRIATIFGTEALSGMKVLLQSSKTELDSLEDGLKNCDGAANNMANTMLDNTKGSIEEMSGSLETAGITIQKMLAPHITNAAKGVTDLANKFSALDKKGQQNILMYAGIAAATGPALKGLSGLTKGVGSLIEGTGTLVKDLNKLSIAKKAAKDIGQFSLSAVSGTKDVSGLSKVLSGLFSPTGLVIAGTALAVGLGIAIASSMKKAKAEAVKANLAEHFGKIELSIKDCEEAAKQLTKTDFSARISLIAPEQEKITEIEDDLKSAIETINKLNWKVSVGLQLTDDEKTLYKQAVDTFIKQSIADLEQRQYTASLRLSAYFGDDSNIVALSNSFYNGVNEDLSDLGNQLSQAVNDAFADGVLSEEEALNIDRIKRDLQNTINKVSQFNFEAKLGRISYEYGKDLSPESFKKLTDEIHETVQTQLDETDTAYDQTISDLKILLDNGAIDQSLFDQVQTSAQTILDSQKMMLELKGADFQLGTIESAYKSDLEEMASSMQNYTAEAFSSYFGDGVHDGLLKAGETTPAEFGSYMDFLQEGLASQVTSKSEEVRTIMSGYWDQLQPTREKYMEIVDKCRETGQAVPKEIADQLSDINNIGAIAGNMDAISYLLGEKLSNDPGFLKVLESSADYGLEVDERIMNGIDDGKVGVGDSVSSLAESARNDLNELLKNNGLSTEQAAEQATGGAIADGMDNSQDVINQSVTTMGDNTATAMTATTDKLKTASGEVINAAYDPWNDPNLQIISNENGVKIVQPVVSGMASVDVATTASTKTTEAVNAMDATFSGADLGGMGTTYGTLPIVNMAAAMGANAYLVNDQASATSGYVKSNLSGLPAGTWGEPINRLFSTSMNRNKGLVSSQAQSVSDYLYNALSYFPAGTWGSSVPSLFAASMSGSKYLVQSQSISVASMISSALSSFPSNTWGSHLIGNLTSGIRGMFGGLRSAVYTAADIISSVLHHTVPEEGPLKDDDLWGGHMVDNIITGMMRKQPELNRKVLSLAGGIGNAFNFEAIGKDFDFSAFESPDWRGTLQVKADADLIDYDRLADTIVKKLDNRPIVVESHINSNVEFELDGQKLGRVLTPAISREMAKTSKLHG